MVDASHIKGQWTIFFLFQCLIQNWHIIIHIALSSLEIWRIQFQIGLV